MKPDWIWRGAVTVVLIALAVNLILFVRAPGGRPLKRRGGMVSGAMPMRHVTAVVLALATCSVAGARIARPPTVELDGCVMPATAPRRSPGPVS